MASNTKRDDLGLRPAPGLREYARSGSRALSGSKGSTRSQNSSVTAHDGTLVFALAILFPCAVVPHGKALLRDEFLDEFIAGDITITPAPPTQSVYAFYNNSIGHDFITGTTAERDLVLRGGAGDGWMIVDDGFKVWPAAGSAPAAAKPVCRFYSPSVNSHFYTAGSGEYESLKFPRSGWTYEGIAFRALAPTNRSCYPGTTPEWRLYNKR